MIRQLFSDRRGSAAADFVLTVPIAIMIIFGSVNLGVLAWANAGIQNGIGGAARTATLWPRRSDNEIKAKLVGEAFGVNRTELEKATMVRGTVGGRDYVDISVNYQTSVNFIFFEVKGITLSHTRRAYFP